MSIFAAVFIALYVGHHVGDYWVQTDEQAQHKGDAGLNGVIACMFHCLTYMITQALMLFALDLVVDFSDHANSLAPVTALLVSVVTHYTADRREHGLMFKLARRIPGKARFLELGKPRQSLRFYGTDADHLTEVEVDATDNPSLGTGAWALDQSWHLFFGVFIPALIVGAWR